MSSIVEQPSARPVSPLPVLAAAVLFCGCAAFVRRPGGLAIMAGLWLVGTILIRVRPLKALRCVARLWPLLLLVFAVHATITSRTSDVYALSYKLTLHLQPALVAALFVARLVLMLGALSVVFEANSPVRYAQVVGHALRSLPGPGRWLSWLGLLAELSLRFTSFVRAESERLRLAFTARGFEAGRSRVWSRMRGYRLILYPLLLSSFRRAEHVSLALTARGFRDSVRPTAFLQTLPRSGEIVLLLAFALLCLSAPWI